MLNFNQIRLLQLVCSIAIAFVLTFSLASSQKVSKFVQGANNQVADKELKITSNGLDKLTKETNFKFQKENWQFFIENKGQWPEEVLYLTRIGGLDA
ncbi:MAG: hypothetical protein N2517_09475, partial [Ignavibacteria bacterium]|nr:hypothetical protein [Ignavibacteria bacterium]